MADQMSVEGPRYRNRSSAWAEQWRDQGWPAPGIDGSGTPRYLLDAYPAALAGDPSRLAALVSDVGWVDAAIQSTGVPGYVLRQLCLQAAELGEDRLASDLRARLRRQPDAVADTGMDSGPLGDGAGAVGRERPDPSMRWILPAACSGVSSIDSGRSTSSHKGSRAWTLDEIGVDWIRHVWRTALLAAYGQLLNRPL
jgi:hypothetical protein